MPNFLLEIGVEEIPDWMIEPALADLHKRFPAARDRKPGNDRKTALCQPPIASVSVTKVFFRKSYLTYSMSSSVVPHASLNRRSPS